ncbi:hypothetical protein [Enterobacter bugandensis]|uniref:hypothetical protein n=1 Tax=Enterobacter bugandensis TaxID=881260 RepID=UPI002003517C|nr:hypothetical protein [Enterobacter bugandensis]MCK7435930.1 hypothetical protein [Enterobacter bugandensis]
MAKRNALDNVNIEPATTTGRASAEKPVSKMFRMTAQQDAALKEAMYLTGESMQSIVIEGIELWIAEKKKAGKM